MLAAAALLLIAPPAQGAIFQDRGGLASGTNGIALGPDGNFWVAEEFNGSVVRLTPGGAVIRRYAVGESPTSITTGPGGRVWVSVTGDDKLVWFDATAADPAAHDVFTGSASSCGPVAIAAGNNGRMYVSFPNPLDPDAPCDPSRIGYVSDTGAPGVTAFGSRGTVFDLAVANGKLFAADEYDDAVRRIALNNALTVETTINVPDGPSGITVDSAGTVWVTQINTGGVARFPGVQNGGSASVLFPTTGRLDTPFGIVAAADGRIYVTGKGSGNLARITPATGAFEFFAFGSEPWDIVNGPDGDLYFTDQNSNRIVRFLSTAPRATTTGATPGTASASVDPRGNDTQVVFDYGPTTAYGATSAAVTLPAGDGPVPVAAALSGLAPGTTYHVRVRATNAEGTVTGDDTTVTTPAAPVDADGDRVSPPLDCNDADATIRPGAPDRPGDKIDQDCSGADAAFPLLGARANFSWGFKGSRTAFTKVTVTGLQGGETIKVTCKTKRKGCKFTSKTYTKVKKGTKSLTSLLGRKRLLKTGAKVEVRVTAADSVGSSATARVGKRKRDPKITRKRINP
jgi:streptogramin lyase